MEVLVSKWALVTVVRGGDWPRTPATSLSLLILLYRVHLGSVLTPADVWVLSVCCQGLGVSGI